MLGSFLRDSPNQAAPSVAAAADPAFHLRDIPTHGGLTTVEAEEAPAASWMKDPEEFEVVMGRRQIASVSFVILVTIAVFSTVAYLAGRWTAKPLPAPMVVQGISERKPVAPAGPAPVQASVALPAASPVSEVSAKEPPIFGEPVRGHIYLQMGAVDKGMANVMVNGLRRLGFPSIISAGPNDRVFRVLVGPLADQKTAQATGKALEAFGLSHFAKKIDDSSSQKAAAVEPNDGQ